MPVHDAQGRRYIGAEGGSGPRHVGASDGGLYSAQGVEIVHTDYQRIRFAAPLAGTWDPNGRISVGWAETTPAGAPSGAVSVTILGGLSCPDPGDACGFSVIARDFLGHEMSGALIPLLTQALREIAAPALNTDTLVGVLLMNEPTPVSATVEGVGCAIHYTGGSRTVRVFDLTNGVLGSADSAANAGCRRATWMGGVYNVATFSNSYVSGFTDAGGYLVLAARNAGLGLASTPLYLGVFCGRSSVAAGAVTVEFQPFAYLCPPPNSGNVPT